jgi:hypothetical protein
LDKVQRDGKKLKGRANDIWNGNIVKDKRLGDFLKTSLAKEMKKKMQIDLKNLASLIEVEEELCKVKTLSDLLTLIWDGSDLEAYANNDTFVTLIEQILLQKKDEEILNLSLKFYCRVILFKKECNENIFQSLSEKKFVSNQEDFFKCMFYASFLIELPQNCLEIVTDNLNNKNEKVRGYVFGIMRRDPRCQNIFLDYCKIILTSLEKQTGVQMHVNEKTLDLLETVVSVKYLDVEVFKRSNDWKRDILFSDICNRMKLLPMDKVNINMNWLAVQDIFGDDSVQILALIQKHSFEQYSDLMKFLSLIPGLTLDEIGLLLLGSSESIDSFWCQKMLTTKLNSSVEKTYLKFLTKKLIQNFSIEDIANIFSMIKKIDNLFAFEDILEFSVKEKITIDDFGSKKNRVLSLDEMKCLVESKYLCKWAKNQPEHPDDERKVMIIFQGLKESGWTLEEVKDIIMTFNRDFKSLLSFLSTIERYSLPPCNLERIKAIIRESKDFEDLIKQTNDFVVENHFQSEGKVKDLNELLAEIANSGDPDLLKAVQNGDFDIENKIFRDHKDKLQWTEKPILIWAKTWAKVAKETKGNETFSDYEGIAVILRANNIITGHTLTHTQILCCLIALRGKNNKLLQVGLLLL